MADQYIKSSSGDENNRIKYGVASMQGSGVPKQDFHTAILELEGSTSFFGVFDGHGGDKVALYCSQQFPVELIEDPQYKNNLSSAMLNSFFSIDEKLKASEKWSKPHCSTKGKVLRCMGTVISSVSRVWKQPYSGPQEEGSTACVALIRGNQIIVANVGDSRCVLSKNGQVTEQSTDHKPNVEEEKDRIEAAGGHVLRNEISKIKSGQFSEYGKPRVDGKIHISRSIGDFAYKQDELSIPEKQKMTCSPHIITVDITDDDVDFLVIATNGIWDVKSSEEVVAIAYDLLQSGVTDLPSICEEIVGSCTGSQENSTVILVQLKADASSSLSGPLRQANTTESGSTSDASSSLSSPLHQANTTASGSTSGAGAKAEIEMVQMKSSIGTDCDKDKPAAPEIAEDQSMKTSVDGNAESARVIPRDRSFACWPLQDRKLKGKKVGR